MDKKSIDGNLALIEERKDFIVCNKKDKGKKIKCDAQSAAGAEHNGTKIMTANWGGGISKNPYMSFKFKGAAAGDKIRIAWVDNQ
ncbi:thiosulfate oxidation carrier complex protein SoxZ, partial [Ilyobacter sp.]|uniref:thiosulfate oxidation carrier complex protein SoxZ n=1 Tax=Ilyobacter sp. TaxID=3100343 RepID=UPI00356B5C77